MTVEREAQVFAVLFNEPGFGGEPVGRVSAGDVVAELSQLDGATTDEATRKVLAERVVDRARGGGSS